MQGALRAARAGVYVRLEVRLEVSEGAWVVGSGALTAAAEGELRRLEGRRPARTRTRRTRTLRLAL